ncbi:MAG: bifunctional phosphoribosylaminoimidazolecarboxamide formyltransferase/IMP cyclohydrolase [Trueperaceae bacterium]|nr:bifunctional phosphoribosylaminoimidazolecarboxamide formyltransferase/IMP cyclohydrolase [Trueperaceae bacterium]
MKRALLSVSDKRGIVDLARGLQAAGVELVSSGGTARTLREAGVPVAGVDQVTGHPEILGGRVKTLHPRIHGGLLARDDEEQLRELADHGIDPFDLLVVNLYPFREAAARVGASEAEVVEQIDIGGPAMVRAAAKTHERVAVVVDPNDYDELLASLDDGGPDAATRRRLARKAFAHTAAYDAAIVRWFDASSPDAERLPPTLHLALERTEMLRYGENPHQQGARYREIGFGGVWDDAVQHKGAPLSFLNLFDAEAAWRLVHRFTRPAAVIVKHANPCGVAVAGDLATAYDRAFAGDPISAFGGVVALNGTVDARTAQALMNNPKADVVVARGFDADALEVLSSKRKAMRVLEAPEPLPRGLDARSLDGGLLVQTSDVVSLDRSAWRVPTRRTPSDAEWRDLAFAWQVCAAVGSNAIVLVKDEMAVGIGAGQPSRVDAARIAKEKADGRARGGACASDAFFPFRDGLDVAAEAGATAVIQPGGSVRDDELVAAADEHGMSMVLTGERHFRH